MRLLFFFTIDSKGCERRLFCCFKPNRTEFSRHNSSSCTIIFTIFFGKFSLIVPNDLSDSSIYFFLVYFNVENKRQLFDFPRVYVKVLIFYNFRGHRFRNKFQDLPLVTPICFRRGWHPALRVTESTGRT